MVRFTTMRNARADIIAQLQKEILPLQGFKPCGRGAAPVRLGAVQDAFPNKEFPLGAIHEFMAGDKEGLTSSAGFVAGILGMLMQGGGVVVWISHTAQLFPPAFKAWGVNPARLLTVQVPGERDLLWAAEETLKCEGLAAVVVEMRELDFTASRRLQLIVERSRVTGFILRMAPRRCGNTASIARWQVRPLSSVLPDDELPGVGYPAWQVELLKIRNGKPGSWQLYWDHREFKEIECRTQQQVIAGQKRKAG